MTTSSLLTNPPKTERHKTNLKQQQKNKGKFKMAGNFHNPEFILCNDKTNCCRAGSKCVASRELRLTADPINASVNLALCYTVFFKLCGVFYS